MATWIQNPYSGSGGGSGSGTVTSVTATDTSIVVSGNTTVNPTIATATLDVIASDHAPAASWSNNSKKITSLANGSGAQDAAAFGQIPTSAATIGGLLAANNLSDVAAQQTALNNLAGAVTNHDVLAGNGTNVTLRALAAADLPTGTTSAQGALQLDGTSSDIQSIGVQAAGSSGLAADAKHVHATQLTTEGDLLYMNATPALARLAVGSAGQLLTPASGVPSWANPESWQSLYLAVSGATAETFPRVFANTETSSSAASGTIYVTAIPMPAGIAVNNITLWVDAVAASSGDVSHGWYALLDNNLVVRAVSADQTSGNWTTTSAAVTLSVSGSSYTTAYSGLYYIAYCITITAGSMPRFTGTTALRGVAQPAPIMQGSSSTSGQNAPPTTGSTLGSLTALQSYGFYAYTS